LSVESKKRRKNKEKVTKERKCFPAAAALLLFPLLQSTKARKSQLTPEKSLELRLEKARLKNVKPEKVTQFIHTLQHVHSFNLY
jgi:hypothetical protein